MGLRDDLNPTAADARDLDLSAWLADIAAQYRTRRAIDAVAVEWRTSAAYRRLDAAFATAADDSAETCAAIAATLLADAWVDTLVAGLADRLRSDPFAEPPFQMIDSDIHKGLAIYDTPAVSIGFGAINAGRLAAKKTAPRGATSINFTGKMSVLRFIRAGDACLSFWEVPRIGADFSLASARPCRYAGKRRIVDGEVLIVDGRRQAYVIEHARANMLLAQAEISADQAPVSVEYDSAGLAAIGCSANDDGASRIQMMATLLRKLDRRAAFPVLASFLAHPDFFVRWHVMRELIGLDARAALPHLAALAEHDPHPDVRAAAQATLARLALPADARKAA
jgi:hypothetical protein